MSRVSRRLIVVCCVAPLAIAACSSGSNGGDSSHAGAQSSPTANTAAETPSTAGATSSSGASSSVGPTTVSSVQATPTCGSASTNSSNAAAAGGKKYVIKISDTLENTQPIGKGVLCFKSLAEKASGGQISVQVFPNNQLGGEDQVLQQLKEGVIQMDVTPAGTAGNLISDIGVMDAPYLWKDWNAEKTVMGGPIFKHFQDEFAQQEGLDLLDGTWLYGLRDLTSNKKVLTPADGAGMKIRTPPAPVNLLSAKVLGGVGTPMDFAQVYLALKSGTIDAEENPLATVVEDKLYEVQKYVMLTQHIQQSQIVMANLKWLKGLPSDIQQDITSAVTQAGDYESALAQAADVTAEAQLKQHGTTIVQVNLNTFCMRARQLDPSLAKSWGGLYQQILTSENYSNCDGIALQQ